MVGRMHDLVLVHTARSRLRVVHVEDVFFLESDRGDTLIHRRAGKPLRDGRRLGEILATWEEHPFVRIHETYAVNPYSIFELRLRKTGRDWEVKLLPPLRTVLPVSRTAMADLWEILGP